MEKSEKRDLSAGRVQSVAVRLIIDRENEIKNFIPEEYWSIEGDFIKGNDEFQAAFLWVEWKKMKLGTEDEVKASIG